MTTPTLMSAAAAAVGSLALASIALAQVSVPLASTMDPSSTISEDVLTGETFVISNGDGTVANGKSGDDDSNPAFGDPFNLFPREADFVVGSAQIDTTSFSPTGVSVLPVTSLDLGELWTADPNRTTTDPSADATVESDISDYIIGLWLFGGPGAITFGSTDASDTATFTDGVLTGLDVEVDASFSAEAFGTPVTWTGTLAFVDDQISFQINDAQPAGFFGDSTLVVDLTGTVSSVGGLAIPEPASLSLLAVPALLLGRRRR